MESFLGQLMVQAKLKRLAKITVRGVVQGVGFRPFVYRLANEYKLKGWVRNTSGSVEIEVEGGEDALKAFLTDLEAKAPSAARIEQVSATFHTRKGYTTFEIQESQSQAGKYQLVSPDIATCTDCRREIFSPADRRYRYPFTNCTNCGPRFTIIEDIPYDRPKTTMRFFKMCPRCQQEYGNPLDRRFHAQPNACSECGPQLELVDAKGTPVSCDDVIQKAAELLKAGKILALRGLGGFQLACDATNDVAVNLLRARKRRPSKPFAVMLASLDEVRRHCPVSPKEAKLLRSSESPIVLLRWPGGSSNISAAVAPNLKYMGIVLPYTPLHHLLLQETKLPLVMTSGNLSEEPIAKDNDEARKRLKGIADYFILHNREIYARYDDSVFIVSDGQPQAVRRARGYAPYPILLPYQSKQILACGAEEKNTFCLTRDEHAFLSQHIGDMENEETLEHFENTIELYEKLFRVEPEVIACDMHPEYLATKYARQVGIEKNLRLVPVQHHHAHIVSCLVENKIKDPVIGVAFDGTGYGTDGTIWGGEFLLADWHNFKRVGHLECVPLPGGTAAIKKPFRMALSYISSLLGEDYPVEGLPLTEYNSAEFELMRQQLKRKINSPLTSSAGRLFDAVSALVGVRGEIDYEAQAAIELEMLAADDINITEYYPFSIIAEKQCRGNPCGYPEAGSGKPSPYNSLQAINQDVRIIKLAELISAVIDDIRAAVPAPIISRKFHNTVARMILQMCQLIAKDTGIKQVALSGGVFQNQLLQKLTLSALRKEGFDVFTHHLVPCNDGGISLGQAVVANFTED